MHGLVQEVGVGIADRDVNFSFELRAELRPIAMQNCVQIVVLAPVIHHGFIDVSGELVEDRGGIAVRPHRRIHRLPNIELLAGTPVGAQRQFVMSDLIHLGNNVAIAFAHGGNGHRLEWAANEIRVGIFVEVGGLVAVKIDRVGAEGPGAVEIFWIKNLRGQRFPSAGRTAGGHAGPALTDTAILFFDHRK